MITNIDAILDNAIIRLVDEPCDFCAAPAHHGACTAMLTFVERLRIRRLCPTCGAEMVRAGKNAWICPQQRDAQAGISFATRLTIREMSRERVDYAPF